MRRLLELTLAVLVLVLGLGPLVSCAEPQQAIIDVTPPSATIVSGQTMQLAVSRHFPGGPVEVVTNEVSYTSSSRNVATVSNTGLVVAGSDPGSITVRIVDPLTDATGMASITVAPPRIESIELLPSPALVMNPGVSRRFVANARFNDGTVRDVTSQVLWSSSNEAAATVGRTPADIGLVTPVAVGDTTITATDAATLVQGRTIVFVRGAPAQLSAILVTPNPAVITAGQTFQFAALGVFNDGSTKDLTKTAIWSSAKETVATIDANGIASGLVAGDTTITASAPASAANPAVVKGSAAAKVQ